MKDSSRLYLAGGARCWSSNTVRYCEGVEESGLEDLSVRAYLGERTYDMPPITGAGRFELGKRWHSLEKSDFTSPYALRHNVQIKHAPCLRPPEGKELIKVGCIGKIGEILPFSGNYPDV